ICDRYRAVGRDGDRSITSWISLFGIILLVKKDGTMHRLEHMQKFLLELGVGFAFVGSQYRLEVEGDEFFVDLLFYHLALSCFLVIELKTTDFKPEYSGQINSYVNVIDSKLRRPTDNPTIGIILCRSRKKSIVEYALRGMSQPISVSTYRTTAALPDEFKTKLPSIEDLQHEIEVVAAVVEEFGQGMEA
ncbi:MULTISPECIES: PDDEXK nuclease domain-containing protein, partial [Trichocoleus]